MVLIYCCISIGQLSIYNMQVYFMYIPVEYYNVSCNWYDYNMVLDFTILSICLALVCDRINSDMFDNPFGFLAKYMGSYYLPRHYSTKVGNRAHIPCKESTLILILKKISVVYLDNTTITYVFSITYISSLPSILLFTLS